jgi:transposase
MAIHNLKNDLNPLPPPPPPTYLVGIDVASEKCTVVILKADKTVLLKPLDFDNTRSGFEWLQQHLTRLEVPPSAIVIGLEATARYWENLYIELENCGYAMILLHPAQTHQWAASRGLRAKTDRLDSLTIARHLLDDEARPAYVASDLIASYRELVRLHTRLSEEAARYKVEIRDLLVVLFPEFTQVFADPTGKTALALLKLYPSAPSFIEAGVETLSVKLHELAPRNYGQVTATRLVELAGRSAAPGLARLARSKSLSILCDQLSHTLVNLSEVENELAKWLDGDSGAQALASVEEFGAKTVAVIRAELGDVQRFSGRDAVVAYAGMDLTVRQSGKWKGQLKLSKRGSGALRRILYMAALGCLRRKGSAFRAYYEAMVGRGVKKRSALMAVMRKMVAVAYSLLKSGGTYDPTKVWAAPKGLAQTS